MTKIATPKRLTPDVARKLIRVNYSSRGGVKPDTIVIHTTEGGSFPGGWFSNPAAQASSHVSVKGGKSERYVLDADKAWTVGNWNPRTLNIEIVGYAHWTRARWLKHDKELKETARWIAHWSITYGIHPINVRRHPGGVCGHVDVSGVGGHWDPGPHFPWDVVLDLAYRIKQKRLKRR